MSESNIKKIDKLSGNTKIGILLAVIVTAIFSITIVKLKQGSLIQGYDHVLRQNLIEENEK
jgi:hypothetical protein